MRALLLAGLPACLTFALACSSADTDVVGSSGGLDNPPVRDGETSSSGGGAPSGSSGSGSSSSSSSSSSSGAVAEEPECDPLWSLTAPEPVAGLPATAMRPSFSRDELTVYFVHVDADDIWRVYAATRSTRGDAFGAPVALGPNVNSGGHALGVWISDDGLELTYTRYDGNPPQIYRVTRESPGAGFGVPSLVRNNTIVQIPVRDGSATFFARNVGSDTHLFHLRPVDAAENTATDLGLGVPTWFEPAAGILWFERYDPGSQRWLPRLQRFVDDAWEPSSQATDLLVYWTSVDRCRLYGVGSEGVVMRLRVPPP